MTAQYKAIKGTSGHKEHEVIANILEPAPPSGSFLSLVPPEVLPRKSGQSKNEFFGVEFFVIFGDF